MYVPIICENEYRPIPSHDYYIWYIPSHKIEPICHIQCQKCGQKCSIYLQCPCIVPNIPTTISDCRRFLEIISACHILSPTKLQENTAVVQQIRQSVSIWGHHYCCTRNRRIQTVVDLIWLIFKQSIHGHHGHVWAYVTTSWLCEFYAFT